MASRDEADVARAERALPIIYVRGYAGSTRGIDKQVDDPFYGFNAGSTHVRVGGDGEPLFYQFESPILRLIEDEGYEVLVQGSQEGYLKRKEDGTIPPATIWVYRFYDQSATTFGKEATDFNIETAAQGLYDYVELVRAKTGAPRVYLVAHSMGGLICRSMIQKVSQQKDRIPARESVDKLFTYGTPHGGISFEVGSGLIDWAMETFGPAGADIFSPSKMFGYLTPKGKWGDSAPREWRANAIDPEAFDGDRVFSLIGTDAKDYGIVEKVVGPKSDGLVMIENAYVRGAHRAFVHRAHSGRYGLVNSEEGYQSLRRFLFGIFRVKVALVGLDLSSSKDNEVWQADVRLSIRGLPIVLHEQTAAHYCPVQLLLEEKQHQDEPDAPVPLITAFLLDPTRAHQDPLEEPPPRCRYSLHVRTLRLVQRDGFFSWNDHLEEVADWDDVLIVDLGRRDNDPPHTMHGWAQWNSNVTGPIAVHDPITNAPLIFVDGAAEVAFPDSARKILGPNARLRFTLSEWR